MTKENAIVAREPSAVEAELLAPETNPSSLYMDESEEELDREIDIPYFSDIENMVRMNHTTQYITNHCVFESALDFFLSRCLFQILEMDLSPDDEESRFRKKGNVSSGC